MSASGRHAGRGAAKGLDALSGIGPKSRAMLHAAGIDTLAALRDLGAVRAYVRVKALGGNASLNLLWALEAALSGLDWREVARGHRTSLLLALEEIECADRAAAARTRAPSRMRRRA